MQKAFRYRFEVTPGNHHAIRVWWRLPDGFFEDGQAYYLSKNHPSFWEFIKRARIIDPLAAMKKLTILGWIELYGEEIDWN